MIQLKVIEDKRRFKKEINKFLKDETILGQDTLFFINELKKHTNVFVIGGGLRNIANEENVRDLDIIISDIDDKFLLDNFDSTLNRHGGYKIKFKKMVVDLWTVGQNWATKNELIYTKHTLTRELAKGTFFNFDSLVYSINSNILECKYYNQCALNNELDIIVYNQNYLYKNPTVYANILRAFFLKEKYGLNFSKKLSQYIRDNIRYYQYKEDLDILFIFRDYLETYPKYKNIIDKSVLERNIKAYV